MVKDKTALSPFGVQPGMSIYLYIIFPGVNKNLSRRGQGRAGKGLWPRLSIHPGTWQRT
jgi:hypothetical protein